MSEEDLTPYERSFNEWKQHSITKDLMRHLAARRDLLRKRWEGGSFTDFEKEATVLLNVGNMGTCKGYAYVMEIEADQLVEKEDGE